jgi:8-oxo-dGTP diphosphatase
MTFPLTQVATALLFDRNGHLLIYLRDDKPTIPFPGYWDLFGGHVEEGESPAEALAREVQEELNLTIQNPAFFHSYHCITGDVHPNVKHVFWVRIAKTSEELILQEGQRHLGIDIKDRRQYRFVNILGNIIEDFVHSDEFLPATQ